MSRIIFLVNRFLRNDRVGRMQPHTDNSGAPTVVGPGLALCLPRIVPATVLSSGVTHASPPRNRHRNQRRIGRRQRCYVAIQADRRCQERRAAGIEGGREKQCGRTGGFCCRAVGTNCRAIRAAMRDQPAVRWWFASHDEFRNQGRRSEIQHVLPYPNLRTWAAKRRSQQVYLTRGNSENRVCERIQ